MIKYPVLAHLNELEYASIDNYFDALLIVKILRDNRHYF